MDKQKQIEEMKKDIAIRMSMAKGVAGSMNNGVEGWLSEYLIEKGYRKIPENAVVLTEKELKEKIDCCNVSMIHHDDDGKRYIEYEKYKDFTDRLGKRIQQLKGLLKQARKETAEKFAERLKTECFDGGIDEKWVTVSFSRLDEICKEITGEN